MKNRLSKLDYDKYAAIVNRMERAVGEYMKTLKGESPSKDMLFAMECFGDYLLGIVEDYEPHTEGFYDEGEDWKGGLCGND